MALVKYETRLSMRRNLDKSDVETDYGNIVAGIGGSYFIGGVAQGPFNGTLDWRNFSKQAGIPLAMRSSPYGIYGLTVDLGAMVTTNNTYLGAVPVPLENVGINPTVEATGLTLIGASMVLRDPTNAANAGNVTIIVRRRSVDTTVSGPTAWTNIPSTRATSVLNVNNLNTLLYSRDVLIAKFVTTSAGVGYGHVIGTFWLKGKHIRG